MSSLNNIDIFELPFSYKQDECFLDAEKYEHSFIFTIDNLSTTGKKKGKKMFNSCSSLKEFISRYQTIPYGDKHFYEFVKDTWYEYYDLDLPISSVDDENIYSEMNLFLWFDTLRSEFFNYAINTNQFQTQQFNFLTKPDWVLLTSSDSTKLSLHLINRNCVFTDNSLFKQIYSSFKSYLTSFVSDSHPFSHSIDFSVCSNFRQMRIIGSSKLGSTRYFRVFEKYHTEPVPLHKTFISDAKNDKLFETKLVTDDIIQSLFLTDKTKHKITHKVEDSTSSNKTTSSIKSNNESIVELLSLLSDERAFHYDDWFKVCTALKNSNQSFDVFDTFSQCSTNYSKSGCEELWNNIKSNHQTPITLGTIHHFAKCDNPDGYKLYIRKYTKPHIQTQFTPDITIGQKHIQEDIYKSNLVHYNTIAIQSNMNTGKTFVLPSVFTESLGHGQRFNRIVVVYFRISLNVELFQKWKQHGFELYSDIKGTIDLDQHPRVIIQLDSIHRLSGACDLLVLDEIESLKDHLCGSKYIDSNRCFKVLMNYVKHTNKLILADASLNDTTVKLFSDMKKDDNKVLKIQNTYHSFSHLETHFYTSKFGFIQNMMTLLENGKKIVIPTNSKRFAKSISKMISNRFPERNILFISSDSNHYTDTSKWSQYDVLVYTPTISVGVSFEQLHFHTVCGYFSNNSCNAEVSAQMLFRVRNLIDKNMFIYTPQDSTGDSLPIQNEEIESYINDKITLGHQHLLQSGLTLNHFTKHIIKNKYYLLYREYLKKCNLSKLYFGSYLKSILSSHGISVKDIQTPIDNVVKSKQLKEEMKEVQLQMKKEDALGIIESKPIIYYEDFEAIKNKRSEKTREENLSLSRYYLTSTFGLSSGYSFEEPSSLIHSTTSKIQNLDEGTKWVEKNIPHLSGYQNYKRSNEIEGLEGPLDPPKVTNIELSNHYEHLHTIKYNEKLVEDYYEGDSSTTEDVENEGINDEDDADEENCVEREVLEKRKLRRVYSKRSVKKTITQSIQYDTKWLKLKHCFMFLHHAGFERLQSRNKEKIKLKWEELHSYLKENERDIRTLFNLKRMSWKDEIDNIEKQSIIKYVNSKLEHLLAIKIIKNNNKQKSTHSIDTLFEL